MSHTEQTENATTADMLHIQQAENSTPADIPHKQQAENHTSPSSPSASAPLDPQQVRDQWTAEAHAWHARKLIATPRLPLDWQPDMEDLKKHGLYEAWHNMADEGKEALRRVMIYEEPLQNSPPGPGPSVYDRIKAIQRSESEAEAATWRKRREAKVDHSEVADMTDAMLDESFATTPFAAGSDSAEGAEGTRATDAAQTLDVSAAGPDKSSTERYEED